MSAIGQACRDLDDLHALIAALREALETARQVLDGAPPGA